MALFKFSGPAIVVMVVVIMKTTFIADVQPLTISGRLTNYTWILERVWIMATNHTQETYKNRIPGIEIHKKRYTHPWYHWRRFNDYDEADFNHEGLNTDDIHVFDIQNGQLKEIELKPKIDSGVDKLLKWLKDEYAKLNRDRSPSHETGVKINIIDYNNPSMEKNIAKSKNTLTESEIHPNYYDDSIEYNMNKDNKSVKRRQYVDKKSALYQMKQKKKRTEIRKFILKNFKSIDYFYSEMLRIMRDGTILDDLRLMINDLEQEGNEKLKSVIFKHYKQLSLTKDKRLLAKEFWNKKPNNLVISLKNPYNDGE